MAIQRVGELAGMQRDLARKQDELARLHHAGLLISSRHRLEETLEAILTMALEVTDAHYGVFRLVDRASGHLVTKAIAGDGLGRPHTEPLPIGATSIMGYVAASRRPLRVSDLRQEPWARIDYPLGQELTMRSELAVPLIGSDGRLEGVLNLESPAVDVFSEADSYLLQALATQAVVAIEQVSLLDALQEITERLLTQPYPLVLRRLSELASRLLNNDAGAVWSERGGKLVLETTAVTSEWDQKVMAILNRYAALALENADRQEALRSAREQQAVAETFAALGDIAANLLHKLNNKVGTIPVRVEGIQDKYPGILDGNPYLAANLADIERSAREAMQAVRESLALLHPLHREPLDLAGCVAEAITAAWLPEGVHISLQGLAGLPRALANEHSLILVIVNLLTNAADAMAGKGTVTISGSTAEGTVLLSVADTGIGIPPELYERVFELHFTGRKSTAPHKLGFGLWWVKTLMTPPGRRHHRRERWAPRRLVSPAVAVRGHEAMTQLAAVPSRGPRPGSQGTGPAGGAGAGGRIVGGRGSGRPGCLP